MEKKKTVNKGALSSSMLRNKDTHAHAVKIKEGKPLIPANLQVEKARRKEFPGEKI